MKVVRVHKVVARDLEALDSALRSKLAELLSLLAAGENLGMPLSRPMPVIASGAHELRVHDHSGQYRIFYFTKVKDAILVFHFLKKKTQATPGRELALAARRLKEML